MAVVQDGLQPRDAEETTQIKGRERPADEHSIPESKNGWILNGPPLLKKQCLELFQDWSGIGASDIPTHVEAVRDRAYEIFPWPCISNYLFLDGVIRDSPYYSTILQRLKSDPNTNILDLGSCFGYDVRILRHEGVPMSQIYAFDLVPEWFTLGYELFRDRDRVSEKHLLVGDFAHCDQLDSSLAPIKGAVDVIHTSSFFHCFDLALQKRFARSCLKTLLRQRPGSMVYGRQLGMRHPRPLTWNERPGNLKFNVQDWIDFWMAAGKETGIKSDGDMEQCSGTEACCFGGSTGKSSQCTEKFQDGAKFGILKVISGVGAVAHLACRALRLATGWWAKNRALGDVRQPLWLNQRPPNKIHCEIQPSFVNVFALALVASASAAAEGFALEPREAPTCTRQLKSPNPPGLVCEQRGYVRRPDVIATAPIAKLNLCRDYCIGNPNCLSFSYATNNRSCTHYRTGILNSGFVRTNNGAIYANRRCYTNVCTCPANSGLTKCGNNCTDTSSDSNNCGGCGNVCSAPKTACKSGVCACPTGTILCQGQCIDISTDRDNCGSCGNACPAAATGCSSGICNCPTGQTLCNGQCVDFSQDINNCGSCGNACPSNGNGCSSGVCTCPTGLTLCGNRCVDIQTDDTNCGRCGNQCPNNTPFCYGSNCYEAFYVGIKPLNANTPDNPDTFLSSRIPENDTVPQYAVGGSVDEANRFLFTGNPSPGGARPGAGLLVNIRAFKSTFNHFRSTDAHPQHTHETFFGNPRNAVLPTQPARCELDDASNLINCAFDNGDIIFASCEGDIPQLLVAYSGIAGPETDGRQCDSKITFFRVPL